MVAVVVAVAVTVVPIWIVTRDKAVAKLMWMGELISQKGIGNGMSLIIFASVVSALPNQRIPLKTNKEVVEKNSTKLDKLVGVW